MIDRFRIFCEPDKPEFFWVEVYAWPHEMQRRLKEAFQIEADDSHRAVSVTYIKERFRGEKRIGESPEIGTIVLVRSDMDIGVVAHEALHAAFHWARRVKVNAVARRNEERFVLVHQWLVRQVFDRCTRAVCDSELTRPKRGVEKTEYHVA